MKDNLKGHHFELGYGHSGLDHHMPMSQFNKGKSGPRSTSTSINKTAENYAHNYQLGYADSQPNKGMKNDGIATYIHK